MLDKVLEATGLDAPAVLAYWELVPSFSENGWLIKDPFPSHI